MDHSKTLYLTDRKAWRQWLDNNFDKEKEIWLVYPKKNSKKPRIQYNDAVEEALCYGWIDSTIHAMDDENYCQRFTPRNSKSGYSQPNKERLKWLLEHTMIHPSMEKKVREILDEPFIFPSDIIDVIKKDKVAWEHYQAFADSYKRIRIAYIESARELPEEFNKRLKHFIGKTRDNKLIQGFGGIGKYY
jgi:uncharacterized protein YdeI (YjbR/CyaY-like superfamily)